MLQPQSDEEIRPVVEALRRLDHRLDIRWNPKAIMTRAGVYGAFGQLSKLPEYDGRWEVILHDTTASLNPERGYTLLCVVTELDQSGPAPLLRDKGPYAPIGMWVVAFMQLWDRAQGRMADEMMKKAWVDHDRLMELDRSRDAAAHREAAEKIYSEHADGGAYLKPMTGTGSIAGAPWLKSKRESNGAPTRSFIEVVRR